MMDSILTRETELRTAAEEAGQGHLFAWWSELNPVERATLLEQVDGIDFPLLQSLIEDLVIDPAQEDEAALEPAPITPIPRSEPERRAREVAREHGETLIREGKVAALVVAGGQGTRLGFDGPKGAFPIGPLSNKCLFAFFAERILATERRYGPRVPWFIMTSPANHAETRDFFARNEFLGLLPDQIHFFIQGTMPAVDEQGKILLDSKYEIARSPDGHGGTLRALDRSLALGILEDLRIEEISYFQVDNVLAKVLDPVFIGYHAQEGAEMSSKVVRKAYPEEKVGIVGMRAGKLGVIEYSDLSHEDMVARDPQGELKYWAGSIAIHMIRVSFVRRLEKTGIQLPFHRADKKIPYIDAQGRRIAPESPNGIKFESFIFDALQYANHAVTQEVSRQEEFSPVKNASGVDSPEMASRDLMEMFASWLEEAGAKVPRDEQGSLAARIEISPLYALDREEALRKIPGDLEVTDDLLLD